MNCLITRSASFNASILNEYTTDLLGQIYPPDEQRKGSDGPASYMNRVKQLSLYFHLHNWLYN